MLILMRRCEESILIGEDIEVKVLKIQGNQVHLGISAPREVAVYRNEIWQQVLDENEHAAMPADDVDLQELSVLQDLLLDH